jgi:exodeoxyribonuclease V beta subunit
VLDIGSVDREENLARARFEQLAENLRLLYVALTRARHRCTIVWGRIGRFATSALGYLLHPPPSVEGAPDVPTIQAHLSGLDDATLLRDLRQHSATAPIVLREFARATADPLPKEREAPSRPLKARRPTRRVDDRWRTSSFSALTSHAPASPTSEEQIPDHDTLAVAITAPRAPLEPATTLRLADFPRGTKAGSFFHDVLEHYDFVSPRPGALAQLVEARLSSYRYPVDTWRERVCEQIFAVLDTPLGTGLEGPALRLGDVPLAERLSELEFCVPVATQSLGDDARALNAVDLAQVFRRYPSHVLPAHYADAVSRLGFIPLRGYLRGFVDLVFRHGERYYLVDYKGNHLGAEASDYSAEALGAAMARGQYFLQYHLYALALHRYLGRRVKAYDFDRHFGGVFYLFIKGMGPELGSSGVFFEKPSLERLTALGALLDRPGGKA